MTRPEQRDEEKAIVEYYLREVGIDGCCELGRDPPDVIAYLADDSLVAVEVTRYYQRDRHKGSTRREVEAAWDRIRERAWELNLNDPPDKRMSVLIEFKELRMPKSRSTEQFIEAVRQEIEAQFSRVSEGAYTYIRIGADHHPLLQDYVKNIGLRRRKNPMMWDWNHNFAGIGTSEQELCDIIRPKLVSSYDGYDAYWLLVASGPSLSAEIGMLWVEQLEQFDTLNADLRNSALDQVVIMARGWMQWTRGHGWKEVERRAG
jgi:hypothetical protein